MAVSHTDDHCIGCGWGHHLDLQSQCVALDRIECCGRNLQSQCVEARFVFAPNIGCCGRDSLILLFGAELNGQTDMKHSMLDELMRSCTWLQFSCACSTQHSHRSFKMSWCLAVPGRLAISYVPLTRSWILLFHLWLFTKLADNPTMAHGRKNKRIEVENIHKQVHPTVRCDTFIHSHPSFAPWLAPSLSSHRRVPMILLRTQGKAVIAKSSWVSSNFDEELTLKDTCMTFHDCRKRHQVILHYDNYNTS